MDPVNNDSQTENNIEKKALTPEQLMHRHMQNPEEPITDEDINNLILDTDAIKDTVKEKEKDIIQTPYEILK